MALNLFRWVEATIKPENGGKAIGSGLAEDRRRIVGSGGLLEFLNDQVESAAMSVRVSSNAGTKYFAHLSGSPSSPSLWRMSLL